MPHIIAGNLVVLASLLLLIMAGIAAFTRNLPGRMVGLTALLLVLAFVQVLLGGIAQDISPLLAALHPVNALVLLGLTFHLARGSRKATTSAEPAASRVR